MNILMWAIWESRGREVVERRDVLADTSLLHTGRFLISIRRLGEKDAYSVEHYGGVTQHFWRA